MKNDKQERLTSTKRQLCDCPHHTYHDECLKGCNCNEMRLTNTKRCTCCKSLDCQLANTKRKCVTCGFDDCWNMQVRSDYDFCCLDVPPKYIKKPFRDWACSFCTVKYVEGFSYKVERIL